MTPAVTEAPSQDFAQRGPVEIAAFLDGKIQELAQLQTQLEQAHNEAESTELDWLEHLDGIMDSLEEEGEKLPGEEKCVSLARRRGGWEAWSKWRRAERRVKKLEKVATLIGNQLSAAQSEGKLLREIV